MIALLVPAQPLAAEQHWADWMGEIQTPLLEHVALFFNYLGRGIGSALALVGIGVVLIAKRRWLALLAYAVTEALTPLLTAAVKEVVDRPRPRRARASLRRRLPVRPPSFAGATCIVAVVLSRSSAGGGAFGGHSRRRGSPAWRGAAPISSCTGCSTSLGAPSSARASRSLFSPPFSSCSLGVRRLGSRRANEGAGPRPRVVQDPYAEVYP